jgi:phenylacetate-CoA ligase
VLTRPGNLDELTVRVESLVELSGEAGAAASLGSALAHRIKNRVGVTAGVEVVAPHSLERSTGKARRIEDLRRG